MNEEVKHVFLCKNIGVSGTTETHVRKNSDGTFEARVGIAILGMTNMDAEEYASCNNDPFHPEFRDNYAVGIGISQEAAIQAMRKDMEDTANSLW